MKKLLILIASLFILVSGVPAFGQAMSGGGGISGGGSWVDRIQTTHDYWVDGSRTDTYTATGSILKPYLTIKAAIDAINALLLVTPGGSYRIQVAAGTYSQNLTITGPRYLRIEGAGVVISGTILINSGVGSYDRIEFVGTETGQADKGPAMTLSGAITLTRTNDSLIYLGFSGCYVTGAMATTDNGTWVCHYQNSRVSGAITGTLPGGGTPSILLTTYGYNTFSGTISGIVALYNCSATEFRSIINTTPRHNHILTDCTFNTGAITITASTAITLSADANTLYAFKSRTPTLTDVTYVDLDHQVDLQTASPPIEQTGNLHISGAGVMNGLYVDTAIITDDELSLTATTGGAARFLGNISSSDLTASVTWLFPNAAGTVAVSATSPVTLSALGDIGWNLATSGTQYLHGIQTTGAITFDNTEHTITLAAGANTYWFAGTKYTTASSVVCDLDLTADRDHASATLTTNTLYFIYFKDATGKLYWSPTAWSISTGSVMVATVHWNGAAGAVQDERHNHTRDIAWHLWAHDTVGTRIHPSDFAITTPSVATPGTVDFAGGNIHDEDIEKNYSQQTACRVWSQASANTYRWENAATIYPSVGVAFSDTANTYTLTAVAAAKHINIWVYAAPDNDSARALYAFCETKATGGYDTVAQARAINPPNLTNLGINTELKLLYRLIMKGDESFVESTDYRNSATLPSGGTTSPSAASVSFSPSGTVSASTVQGAIEELDTEKLSAEADTLATVVARGSNTGNNSITVGNGTASTDYTITFNGETNDGVITWMEDEDLFTMECGLSVDGAIKTAGDTLTARWTTIPATSYTATPASTSTLTMSVTSPLVVGLPVRYTISSVVYYGIITTVTANTSIAIAGAPMGGDVTAFAYGRPEMIAQVDIAIPGDYGAATGDVLASLGKSYFSWRFGKAYLVAFSGVHNTAAGTTNPKVNVKVNAAAVSTNDTNLGIQLSTAGTWVDNSAVAINTSNYDINKGEAVEINCTAAGVATDGAKNLTVSLTFVLE